MRLQHRLFYSEIDHKTKKWKTIFGNKKRIPMFHIPEILLNLKNTWMIARVPNKIRTHKRATETNFVVEAISTGFSAPRMSQSFLLSSSVGISRTGSWEFMWAVRSVTLCSLTFCHVEKIHWVLEQMRLKKKKKKSQRERYLQRNWSRFKGKK